MFLNWGLGRLLEIYGRLKLFKFAQNILQTLIYELSEQSKELCFLFVHAPFCIACRLHSCAP